MERHIQADNAFIKWMEAMSKNVVHIADAWQAAVKWADSHPAWIPVEEELPPKFGRYMFLLASGDMVYEVYYPDLKLVENVTHWMEIVPPRKEE